MTEPTCDERIDEQLADRNRSIDTLIDYVSGVDATDADDLSPEDLKTLQDHGVEPDADGWIAGDDVQRALDEWPADIDTKTIRTVTILLSGGGPQDQFELDYDEDGDLIVGRYRFLDWYDGATRRLSSDRAQLVADTFGVYLEGLDV